MDFRRGHRREDPEINLIPMIDILLVILIFLMVTTTFIHQRGLQIQLPAGSQQNNQLPLKDVVEVSIAANGEVSVGQDLWQRSSQSLNQLLKQHPQDPSKTHVVIRADKRVTHGEVMMVIDEFQRLGFHQFTLVTKDNQS